ncbi:MAG: pyridoxal 5'-phosphate synthase glutaminase subunit PdxT [Deltaproteobacteria bacterium]
MKDKKSVIGVLDLQGGVHEHLDHLDRLGISYRRVKEKIDFEDLAGLIIPGGESSCLCRLINIFEIKEVLLANYNKGLKIWGTCAGTVLLAKSVVGEESCLGLIDIEVQRNSFGSQLDSFMSDAIIKAVDPEPIPLTFIRAPKILKVGEKVNVLLKIDDYIAAAESEDILVTVFHPELTASLAFHRYFAIKCGLKFVVKKKGYIDPAWGNYSWTRMARVA